MTYRPYDVIISQAASAGSSANKMQITNQSGSAIPVLYGVSIDDNGRAKATDVSVENDAIRCAGISTQNINNNSDGEIVTTGKLENITTTLSFGDWVYLSKTGGLTNTKPEYGTGGFTSGDWAIRVGVIARNAANPSNKDLLVSMLLIGQIG